MPIPTTRYERFRFRQRRWADRRRRAMKHNMKIGVVNGGHHGGGKTWPLVSKGKQQAHGVSSASFQGHTSVFPYGAYLSPVFTFEGYARPPFVKFTGMFYLAHRAGGSHQQWAFVGFHVHRVLKTGRKPNRMNGFQRRKMGAEWYAYRFGWFPNWDPLHRYPNAAELLADPLADVGGIWPWGVQPF